MFKNRCIGNVVGENVLRIQIRNLHQIFSAIKCFQLVENNEDIEIFEIALPKTIGTNKIRGFLVYAKVRSPEEIESLIDIFCDFKTTHFTTQMQIALNNPKTNVDGDYFLKSYTTKNSVGVKKVGHYNLDRKWSEIPSAFSQIFAPTEVMKKNRSEFGDQLVEISKFLDDRKTWKTISYTPQKSIAAQEMLHLKLDMAIL